MKLEKYLKEEQRYSTDEQEIQLRLDIRGALLYLFTQYNRFQNLGQDHSKLWDQIYNSNFSKDKIDSLVKGIRAEKDKIEKEAFNEMKDIWLSALGLLKAKAAEASLKYGQVIEDSIKKAKK
ncbi:MAG: hypothetical protein WC503_02965 [Candidatus Shapirobacteria bacterium]